MTLVTCRSLLLIHCSFSRFPSSGPFALLLIRCASSHSASSFPLLCFSPAALSLAFHSKVPFPNAYQSHLSDLSLDIFLLAFDMTRPSTLDGLSDWVEEFREIEPDAAVVVVGCKADLWREGRQSVLDGKFTAEGGGKLSDEDKLSLQEMRQVLCVSSRVMRTLSIELCKIASLCVAHSVCLLFSVSLTVSVSVCLSLCLCLFALTVCCVCLPSIVMCTIGTLHAAISQCSSKRLISSPQSD